MDPELDKLFALSLVLFIVVIPAIEGHYRFLKFIFNKLDLFDQAIPLFLFYVILLFFIFVPLNTMIIIIWWIVAPFRLASYIRKKFNPKQVNID